MLVPSTFPSLAFPRTPRRPRLILYFCCPTREISHLFTCLKQNLDPRCTHSYCNGLASRPSQQIELGNTWVCTNPCTRTKIRTSVPIQQLLCPKVHEFILTTVISGQHHAFHLCPPPFSLFVMPLSNHEKRSFSSTLLCIVFTM